MSVTYYTVDDLRPGRSGWNVRQFSALAAAIEHYRSLPMDGTRVLGMADDAHAYELIRYVRLFPGDAQGEDVLAADHWRGGLTKKNAALKDALSQIEEAVQSVLERTPPELASDVVDRGIVLTGGGALLNGLEELIESKTGINTMTAEEPMTAVAIGTGRYVELVSGGRKLDA